MKGMTLISSSMQINLTSLCIQGIVPVLCIFHGLHEVSMGTVQALFCRIPGAKASWGALKFGPDKQMRSFNHFNEHPAILRFLRESSL
jgi:hypothetical protein